MDHEPRNFEWQRRYEQNDTPWDKGAPAPALVAYLQKKPISGRVLVPGCGRGHEVRLLGAQADTSVVGLDISTTAVAQAKRLTSPSLSNGNVSFLVGNFFHLPPEFKGSFDWLVEHTCFCAIEPRQRPDYVLAAASALRTSGRIFGIFYLNPDTESGPPFAISQKELDGLFDPYFTLVEEWVPVDSFPGREDRELVRIIQKR
ncbi:MAG: TPMT family class I SAM-dependent methyltransferase [Methylacidiphilales bacterium]|nr:TPMT family class I SAM-dependent methyltransferase [Candidatus Methylacidiphilales bacterium]